jgi:hypothetical protein
MTYQQIFSLAAIASYFDSRSRKWHRLADQRGFTGTCPGYPATSPVISVPGHTRTVSSQCLMISIRFIRLSYVLTGSSAYPANKGA